jgi:hypothetical protein
MISMARDGNGPTGNTDDSKRGRGLGPDGREPGEGPLSGVQADSDEKPAKRAEDYGGGPVGGRHKKDK